MESIRDKYKLYGIKNYYQFHGGEYSNPHESAIDNVIRHIYDNWTLDFSNVLDLMCGDGAVTKTLINLGVEDVEGVDGYLCDLYMKKTGNPCRTISFDNIIEGELDGNYSLVICSYSLHLLEPSKLPVFLYQLGNITKELLILSPHKKPEIKIFWEIKNEIVIDRVRATHFHKKIENNF